ncbi:hypothetical protein [Vibrio sinaloensis]|uniref:hypothetical protein n=1 Tax=Photobacterium sp. (strain ATCC 43367) TaxID=379097 RepID=UPI0022AF327B|nr:hypothetical protein [Vibrio sinaloensis]MCZ4294500.1 hypothetical protein [Vibrio sinaloensis]
MTFAAKPDRKNPVYFEHHADGYWCSIDGLPEYFKSKHEMYLYACEEEREIIEITHDNESQLRANGAFDRVFHDE